MENEKIKRLEIHQKISIFLFIIFLILFYLSFQVLYKDVYSLKIFLLYGIVFLLPYLLYITVITIFIFIKYKKILFLNLAAVFILIVWLILYLTGFCFSQMRYVSKAEIIDFGLKNKIWVSCLGEYKAKNNINEKYLSADNKTVAKEECSFNLESIKQEAPQCFGDTRNDTCMGVVTYFDTETKSTKKENIEIYRLKTARTWFKHFCYKFRVLSDIYKDEGKYSDFPISPCGDYECSY
jgi:hypothetical protein